MKMKIQIPMEASTIAGGTLLIGVGVTFGSLTGNSSAYVEFGSILAELASIAAGMLNLMQH